METPRWEVTPIRQNMGKKSSIQPGYQKFPTEISVKGIILLQFNRVHDDHTKELNEELPFTTILKFMTMNNMYGFLKINNIFQDRV